MGTTSFKKILALLFIMTLVACGDSKKSNKNVLTNSTDELSSEVEETENTSRTLEYIKKRKVEFAEDFSNIESFKENINNYTLTFRPFAGNYAGADINCQKTLFDQKNDSIKGKFDDQGIEARIEISVTEADPHEMKFSCEISIDGERVDFFKDKLLKSYVISGEKNLVQYIGPRARIGTLLIEADAELTTNDVDVELEVKELISQGGKIMTFPERLVNTTIDDNDGLSGGKISIKARKAYGDLSVELRGLNGGKQTKLKEQRQPKPRDPKLNGTCPSRVKEGHYNPKNCVGKNGHKGDKGYTGFKGRSGGNSGSFDIKAEQSFLSLTVNYFPGLGGAGGEGGKGGLGSPGGYGNTVEEIPVDARPGGCIRCGFKSMAGSKYKDGLPGPLGEPGDQGKNGDNGKNDDSTIALADSLITINTFWKNH